jgi:hypothetical protein
MPMANNVMTMATTNSETSETNDDTKGIGGRDDSRRRERERSDSDSSTKFHCRLLMPDASRAVFDKTLRFWPKKRLVIFRQRLACGRCQKAQRNNRSNRLVALATIYLRKLRPFDFAQHTAVPDLKKAGSAIITLVGSVV